MLANLEKLNVVSRQSLLHTSTLLCVPSEADSSNLQDPSQSLRLALFSRLSLWNWHTALDSSQSKYIQSPAPIFMKVTHLSPSPSFTCNRSCDLVQTGRHVSDLDPKHSILHAQKLTTKKVLYLCQRRKLSSAPHVSPQTPFIVCRDLNHCILCVSESDC